MLVIVVYVDNSVEFVSDVVVDFEVLVEVDNSVEVDVLVEVSELLIVVVVSDL